MPLPRYARGLPPRAKPYLWWQMWKGLREQGLRDIQDLNFKYDTSNDGYIAGSEEGKRFMFLRTGRG